MEIKGFTHNLNNKLNKKKNFGYYAKIISFLLIIVILIIGLSNFLSMSFAITKKDTIKYSEKGTVDYKVYLKDNTFYETNYLEKGMAYVASLVDKISIDYHYLFNISRKEDLNFNYKIIGKLVIKSQNDETPFYEKEYDLTDSIERDVEKTKKYAIDENIIIDYNYYNDLSSKFRANYAINTISYLEVYLEVYAKTNKSLGYKVDHKSKSIVTIPLSKQEVNVTVDNKEANSQKEINIESRLILKNKYFLLESFILFVFLCFTLFELYKTLQGHNKRNNTYDKYISKILRAYDRIIVEVKELPDLEKYDIIEVKNFDELLDLSDNLKKPISYLEEKDICSKFFVIDGNVFYICVIRESELDGSNNEI